MNKRTAFQKLIETLEEYNGLFNFHENFIGEFADILHKNASGHEKEVFNIVIKQFNFVRQMGREVYKADSNEILKETGDVVYYSLHIQDKVVNIRMLMTFSDEEAPVFLAAFFERQGKNATDYTQWIPVIKERYKQMGEEEHEEE